LEYFGKTSEELKDWALIDVVHPHDLPRVIEARTKSIAVSPDGWTIPYPQFDESGSVLMLVENFR